MRDGTGVRFVHALTREAVYEGVRPAHRRTLHRRAGETLLAACVGRLGYPFESSTTLT